MSKKYINADALAKRAYEVAYPIVYDNNSHERGLSLMGIAQILDEMATADVRENVRGEWVKDELGTTVCSNCKNPRRDNRIKHIAFCNSCGADMRGEEHGLD